MSQPRNHSSAVYAYLSIPLARQDSSARTLGALHTSAVAAVLAVYAYLSASRTARVVCNELSRYKTGVIAATVSVTHIGTVTFVTQ